VSFTRESSIKTLPKITAEFMLKYECFRVYHLRRTGLMTKELIHSDWPPATETLRDLSNFHSVYNKKI
jgi:hypothetical protein